MHLRQELMTTQSVDTFRFAHRCGRSRVAASVTLCSISLLFTTLTSCRDKAPSTVDADLIRLDKSDARVKAEMAALHGRWKRTSRGGLDEFMASDHYFGRLDDGMAWYQLSLGGNPIEIDPTCDPKKLDLRERDETYRGIYRLQGDKLQIVLAGPTERRPTNFPSGLPSGYVFTRAKDESVAYYAKKLMDKNYRWDGPCWNGFVLPRLQAARALAYLGDPAVPALLQAARNETIDIHDVTSALGAIGLPTDKYWHELEHHYTSGIEKWWNDNRERTAVDRSKRRLYDGLPPVEGVDVFAPSSWWTTPLVGQMLVLASVILLVAAIVLFWRRSAWSHTWFRELILGMNAETGLFSRGFLR
jgi:uncharacterized protein (TIGR03067 family)